MSNYLIGDVHGCFNELQSMLDKIRFNPTLDTLWLTGDLVGRGPDSLKVLRLLYELRNHVRVVLGNHDLYLLAIYSGAKYSKNENQFVSILQEKDANILINWLRFQPLIQIDEEKKLIMVHAGIMPQWTIFTAKKRAMEVEKVLRSNNYSLFLQYIYNNDIIKSLKNNSSFHHLQFSIDVFTRMRYCFPDGRLEMTCKEFPLKKPSEYQPWFEFPRPISQEYSIVFGHWSSLNGKLIKKNIYGIDTGCCWGGKLTSLHWEKKIFVHIPSNNKK